MICAFFSVRATNSRTHAYRIQIAATNTEYCCYYYRFELQIVRHSMRDGQEIDD